MPREQRGDVAQRYAAFSVATTPSIVGLLRGLTKIADTADQKVMLEAQFRKGQLRLFGVMSGIMPPSRRR